MIKDLLKMEVEERTNLYLQSTYFNIHFNRTRKYRGIFNALSSLFPKKDKELWCIITNTARAIKYQAKGMQIPRRFAPYKDNQQGISHQYMNLWLDKLEEQGYLHYYHGGLVGMDKEDRLPSVHFFTDKYLALWEGIDVSKEDSENPLMQVRDRITKEELNLPPRAFITEMKKLVKAYNELLEATEISVRGVVLPTQQYKRVFSDNILRGGRWYNLSGCIQTMPSGDRPFICINGEPTVELDYKALHPSILYDRIEGECNIVVDMEDPYDVNLDGLFVVEGETAQKSKRSLIKQVLLKILNAKDEKSAYGTITQTWYEEHQKGENGAFSGLMFVSTCGTFPVKALCERVMEKHTLIKEAFFSDTGISLQKIDSDMIGIVLKCFTEICVCALSWHDSVVVPAKYEQLAKDQMMSAYKIIVGSDNHCIVERA